MEKNPILKNHMGFIDGLRAVTALYVVWHHVWLTIYEHVAYPVFFKVFVYGREAVDVFIVLSGFCLMLPVLRHQGYLKEGAMGFYIRRAWRILPPYYAAMAFSLVFIFLFLSTPTGTHWDACLPVTLRGILLHLGLVHDFMSNPSDGEINYVFWSIAVEWRIYFLFPLLVLCSRHVGVQKTVMGAVLLSVLIFWTIDFGCGIPLTSQFIGLFAMGMLGAEIAYGTEAKLAHLKKWPWTGLTILAGFLAMIAGAIHFGPHEQAAAMKEYLFGLFAMCLLVASSFPQTLPHRLLSFGPLVLVGSFAYSIYLIHVPILAFLFEYLVIPLKVSHLQAFALLTLTGLPTVTLISYGFFRCFEYPFLRKRPNVIIPAPQESAAVIAA
jgi:peptidoglycan/LPS O-acetylase OafA/YrhL